MRIGLLTCASMLDQVRLVTKTLPDNAYSIYPVLPCCLFPVGSQTLRTQIDKSVIANESTIIIYGSCHPDLEKLMNKYRDYSISMLGGKNCWEMSLPPSLLRKCLRNNEWMLSKPFLTKWRKEVIDGFGLNTKNGRVVLDSNVTKMVALRFKGIKFEEQIISEFADKVGIPYSIQEVSNSHLKIMLTKAVAKFDLPPIAIPLLK
ncbi:hypothetical protein Dform_01999 [Dehalogenimonas formicexedens]|uniref:DUF1638 domain-containing protein n=2 Tax=Dehalogenimonas TaxID=670486 RepID=A0A1P8FA30_9CHLR|nr:MULTISPECIES: DUF1638 domain-containing protein [Dehalogenimonas]APV45312.1 hypothetical protein Dform_01999 [Dehalogenimonas formicexedens]KTB49117.1 Protein of unknown function (DUF1638) [Dehalogenimonas alkenigignens]